APRAAVLDTLAGELGWQGEIADMRAFSAVRDLRRKLPGRSSFLVFSPDARTLELFDFLGRHAPVTLPVPYRRYDPTTLEEQEDFAGRALLFSLAIDPLNPDAVARGKKDSAFLDLYRIEREAPKSGAAAGREPLRFTVARVLRAPMDERP